MIIRLKNGIYAKLQWHNLSGSIKHRPAKHMIERAEARSELRPGMTILEATSGNMGIALATIGARRGYGVKIFMSEGMSRERQIMISSLGAELVLTDRNLGTLGAIQMARAMAEDSPDRYWFADQFNNPDNVVSHFETADEILIDLPDVDIVVAGVGTGGTVMGLARRFKEVAPHIKVVGVIPQGGYQIQGLQNPYEDFRGEIFESGVTDHLVTVSAEDAFAEARRVAREEGLFVGMSSGATLFASKKFDSGKIVAIIPDRGEKYLSTNLFQ